MRSPESPHRLRSTKAEVAILAAFISMECMEVTKRNEKLINAKKDVIIIINYDLASIIAYLIGGSCLLLCLSCFLFGSIGHLFVCFFADATLP